MIIFPNVPIKNVFFDVLLNPKKKRLNKHFSWSFAA
jgi:hypothetical protein